MVGIQNTKGINYLHKSHLGNLWILGVSELYIRPKTAALGQCDHHVTLSLYQLRGLMLMRCRVYSTVWDRLFSVPHPQRVNCCGPLRVQLQLNSNRIAYLQWSWLCPSACRLRGSCPVKSITQQPLTALAEYLHFLTTGFSGRPKQNSDSDPSFYFLIHCFDFFFFVSPSLLEQLRKRFCRVVRNKKHPFVWNQSIE